jgi:hypothetical protein
LPSQPHTWNTHGLHIISVSLNIKKWDLRGGEEGKREKWVAKLRKAWVAKVREKGG